MKVANQNPSPIKNTPTQNMMGRKYNIDDRKRQGQHKIPNTDMDRHGQDKIKVSIQHQPYGQAFKMPYKNRHSVSWRGLAVISFFNVNMFNICRLFYYFL